MTRKILTVLMAAVILMAACGLWLSASADAPPVSAAVPTATMPPVDDGTPAPPPVIVEPPDYVYPYPYPAARLPFVTGYPAHYPGDNQ